MSLRLKSHGYTTWTAGDSITGLKLAVRHQPDLIILDISLPGGSGFSVAEQFTRLRETRGIPTLFATASNDPRLFRKIIDLGAAGLLRKPFEGEELLAAVKGALEQSVHSDRPPLRQNRRTTMDEFRPKKVLIVDDDEKFAKSLVIRMKVAGFETAVAHDALAGVRAAVRLEPDLILLDIFLPAGNGFTVAERIQNNIPIPIPIIFLTAGPRPEFRNEAQRLGAAGYFEKSHETTTLLGAVKRVLHPPSRP